MGRLGAAALTLSAALITALTPAATGTPALTWRSCAVGASSQCSTLRVPVDWARGTGRLDLAVSRLPARDPARRIEVLLFNPGGPGSGTEAITARPEWAAGFFPKDVLDRFDLVGIDFRGTGNSRPVDCDLPAHNPQVDRFPLSPAGVAELAAANAAFAASCVARTGPVMAHLDTESVARDMDALRAALGERQISYLGVSYGTMLGQSYAELFPHRLRALALDAVVDRSLTTRQLVEDNAVATQDGVRQFAAWCAREVTCALHGKDVSKVIGEVSARADRGEVKAGTTVMTARELHIGITTLLNSGAEFPAIGTGLLAAVSGDGTGLYTGMHTVVNLYRSYRSIICQDVPGGFAAHLPETVRRVAEIAPDLAGHSEFWDIASGCAGWPLPSRWTPRPWRASAALPPVLLVSGAHDVATLRAWAENVQRQIPGSALLRWEGVGHSAWTMNNVCAHKATARYLLTLELPTGSC